MLKKDGHRRTTVTCYSSEAQTYFIHKENFIKIIDTFKLQKHLKNELIFVDEINKERIEQMKTNIQEIQN